MTNLEEHIEEAIRKENFEELKKASRDLSFVRQLSKEINRASNAIKDVVSTAAHSLGNHFNSYCSVGLKYDEEIGRFLNYDKHERLEDREVNEITKKIMFSAYEDLETKKRFVEGNNAEYLMLPIIDHNIHKRKEDGKYPKTDERPQYAENGIYGVIRLVREKDPKKPEQDLSFKEIDISVLEEIAEDIILAANDNHATKFDKITGGYNDKELWESLDEQKKEAMDNPDYTFSVIMFDLDHFKQKNDTYGHPQGDSILREFYKILSKTNGGATAARYGGEEFTLVLPGRNLNQSVKIAQEIRETTDNYNFTNLKEKDKPIKDITVSGGCAEFDRENPDILDQADEQMYHAKKNGRNRIYPRL